MGETGRRDRHRSERHDLCCTGKGEVIYSRLQNFGGDQYSQALASFYNLSLDDAEQAKLQGKLPVDHELDVLLPHMNALLQQVRRNVQLFCSSSGHEGFPDWCSPAVAVCCPGWRPRSAAS